MEQNLPIIAKKVWSLMRVMFFMLKKGISKTKFFADLNTILKRGKIAGKALQNLLFHHHHNWAATTFHRQPHHLPSGEYQFSYSNTPPYPLSLFSNHKKHHDVANNAMLSPPVDEIDEIIMNPELLKALGMLTAGSPVLSVHGKSPVVMMQPRITDSPFPLSNCDEDGEVDKAADKFIMRFYNGLRREN